MMRERATIREVAERAGVSRAAVSKVLRDAYGVSDAMRKRVGEAIDALAYRPQIAARGLRGSTDTLGVILPEFSNPFFFFVFDGIGRRIASTRYQPLLGVRPTAHDTERAIVETMLDRKLDGLIMIPVRLDLGYLSELAARVPLVVIGDHSRGGGYDSVNGDDALGARMAVEHLIDQGHARIAFCALPPDMADPTNPSSMRRDSYKRTMQERGLSAEVNVIDVSEGSTRARDFDALRNALSAANRPSAIVAWTDSAALLAIEAAMSLGLSVPGDLAVVGYDDSPLSGHPLVGLSSVNQSGDRLGELAADALIERLAGRAEERHDVLIPKLVARASSRG